MKVRRKIEEAVTEFLNESQGVVLMRYSYYIIWHPDLNPIFLTYRNQLFVLADIRFTHMENVCKFINSRKCLGLMIKNKDKLFNISNPDPFTHLMIVKTGQHGNIIQFIKVESYCSRNIEIDDDRSDPEPPKTPPQKPIIITPKPPEYPPGEGPIPFNPDDSEDEDETPYGV
jgi:hypothetical protein